MTKALVVYDTKYGNTKKVAKDIASGIESQGIEVSLKPVKETTSDELTKYDLCVIGAPTHVGGAKKDTKKFIKKLKGTDLSNVKFAAYDTRMNDASKHATIKIEKLMTDLGATKLHEGLTISVSGMKGPLEDSAEEKSKTFGSELGKKIK